MIDTFDPSTNRSEYVQPSAKFLNYALEASTAREDGAVSDTV